MDAEWNQDRSTGENSLLEAATFPDRHDSAYRSRQGSDEHVLAQCAFRQLRQEKAYQDRFRQTVEWHVKIQRNGQRGAFLNKTIQRLQGTKYRATPFIP